MKLNGKLQKTYQLSLVNGLLLAGAIFMVALGLGWGIEHDQGIKYTNQVVRSIKAIRENNFNYHYIFPLLYYDFAEANQYFEDTTMEHKINEYINSQYQNQNAQSISAYMRNFSDNQWAGVNENTQYHPGSLLKILIMMAYFREAEINPAVLQKSYQYTENMNQEVKDLQYTLPTVLKVGQIYTVRQLLENMIANSDNGAETLLIENIDHGILDNAYSDLSIPNPDSTDTNYTISPYQYAGFLRILYSSTYLTEAYSEQALSLMAKSTYRDGISAGLPPEIVTAQKYGERVDESRGNIQGVELHDCGIIYTRDPYILCVMTKGSDVKKLTSIIKDISALVYKEKDQKDDGY